MSGSDLILFSVDSDGTCRAGLPPAAYLDNYNTRALKMGKLSDPSHAVFSPEGKLYVVKGSEIYMGEMPSSSSKNWFEVNAKRVGKTDWERFKRLFFHPDGTLYGVTHEGAFYKGPPPTNENVAWLFTKATKIGSAGWDAFHALCFDPKGVLYAVTDDKFVKNDPPASAAENWLAASQTIGLRGWRELGHWMAFSPDGRLWCASESEGELFTASPPTSEDDEWKLRAEKLGRDYNYKFMAFTRDRTIKSIVTFDFQPDAGKIIDTVPEVVAQQVYDNRHSTTPLNSVFSFNKTVASESTFSHEHGFAVGMETDVSFKTSVPFIAEGGVKVSVNTSTTHNWTFTEVNKTETQYSMSQTFQVAPGKAVRQKAVAQKAKIKVPYTAKVLTMFDYEASIEGTWDATTYFNLSVVQEDV